MCEAGLPAFIDADTFEWIETIRKIEAMDIRYIMPGHGKVCTVKEARVFRQQMEDLVAEVEKCIDGGLSLTTPWPRSITRIVSTSPQEKARPIQII